MFAKFVLGSKAAKTLGLLGVVLALALAGSAVFASPIQWSFTDSTYAPPYGTVTYYETFVGGELATISIDGDGGTDLDLYVYDENGHLIRSAIGLTDHEIVTFRPLWTGPFRIVVRNLGGLTNWFRLNAY